MFLLFCAFCIVWIDNNQMKIFCFVFVWIHLSTLHGNSNSNSNSNNRNKKFKIIISSQLRIFQCCAKDRGDFVIAKVYLCKKKNNNLCFAFFYPSSFAINACSRLQRMVDQRNQIYHCVEWLWLALTIIHLVAHFKICMLCMVQRKKKKRIWCWWCCSNDDVATPESIKIFDHHVHHWFLCTSFAHIV